MTLCIVLHEQKIQILALEKNWYHVNLQNLFVQYG